EQARLLALVEEQGDRAPVRRLLRQRACDFETRADSGAVVAHRGARPDRIVMTVEPDRRAGLASLATRHDRSRPPARAAAAAGAALDHFRPVSELAQLGDQPIADLRVVRAADRMRRLLAQRALPGGAGSPRWWSRRRRAIAQRSQPEQSEDGGQAAGERAVHARSATSRAIS